MEQARKFTSSLEKDPKRVPL